VDTNTIDVRVILSALWVTAVLVWQQGDVQRLYSGDFQVGQEITGAVMSPETLWMISAITMTLPVAMVVLSLTVPGPVNRWVNIVMGVFYTAYGLIGLPKYPSAYDRFLVFAGVVSTALVVRFAWRWI